MAIDVAIRLEHSIRQCHHGYPNGLGDSYPSPTACSTCDLWRASLDEINRLRSVYVDTNRELEQSRSSMSSYTATVKEWAMENLGRLMRVYAAAGNLARVMEKSEQGGVPDCEWDQALREFHDLTPPNDASSF